MKIINKNDLFVMIIMDKWYDIYGAKNINELRDRINKKLDPYLGEYNILIDSVKGDFMSCMYEIIFNSNPTLSYTENLEFKDFEFLYEKYCKQKGYPKDGYLILLEYPQGKEREDMLQYVGDKEKQELSDFYKRVEQVIKEFKEYDI